MKKLASLLFLLVACNSHTGDLREHCNPDGTCNSTNTSCQSDLMGEGYYCFLKPAPPDPNRKCYYESECFCVTCAEKCGEAGVKECAYSDTSVWGSKPAVCECK